MSVDALLQPSGGGWLCVEHYKEAVKGWKEPKTK